jgi:hypothetical protein
MQLSTESGEMLRVRAVAGTLKQLVIDVSIFL